jgi:hypothetical protein
VHVAPGSELAQLITVAKSLVRGFGWREPQATVFVLTGLAPFLPAVQCTLRHRLLPVATSRIVIEADPTTPPVEVERAFREARRKFGRERFRPISDRQIALAVFVAERRDLDDDLRLEQWNAEHRSPVSHGSSTTSQSSSGQRCSPADIFSSRSTDIRKAGRVRGHITKKGSRYWVVVNIARDPETRRRRQQWHGSWSTRAEAEDELNEIVGRLRRGAYVAPSRLTVAEFITAKWLPAAGAALKPSTAKLYETIVDAYVVPNVGGVPLQTLSAAGTQRLLW